MTSGRFSGAADYYANPSLKRSANGKPLMSFVSGITEKEQLVSDSQSPPLRPLRARAEASNSKRLAHPLRVSSATATTARQALVKLKHCQTHDQSGILTAELRTFSTQRIAFYAQKEPSFCGATSSMRSRPRTASSPPVATR